MVVCWWLPATAVDRVRVAVQRDSRNHESTTNQSKSKVIERTEWDWRRLWNLKQNFHVKQSWGWIRQNLNRVVWWRNRDSKKKTTRRVEKSLRVIYTWAIYHFKHLLEWVKPTRLFAGQKKREKIKKKNFHHFTGNSVGRIYLCVVIMYLCLSVAGMAMLSRSRVTLCCLPAASQSTLIKISWTNRYGKWHWFFNEFRFGRCDGSVRQAHADTSRKQQRKNLLIN